MHIDPSNRKLAVVAEVVKDFPKFEIAVVEPCCTEICQSPQELRAALNQNLITEALADMRIEQQADWSWDTAVRAALRRAKLGKNSDEEDALQKVQNSWRRKPICTSVAVTFWQRYLCKLAQHYTQHGKPTSEMSLIRRWMPVQADRTLPKDLLTVLQKVGWTTVKRIPMLPVDPEHTHRKVNKEHNKDIRTQRPSSQEKQRTISSQSQGRKMDPWAETGAKQKEDLKIPGFALAQEGITSRKLQPSEHANVQGGTPAQQAKAHAYQAAPGSMNPNHARTPWRTDGQDLTPRPIAFLPIPRARDVTPVRQATPRHSWQGFAGNSFSCTDNLDLTPRQPKLLLVPHARDVTPVRRVTPRHFQPGPARNCLTPRQFQSDTRCNGMTPLTPQNCQHQHCSSMPNLTPRQKCPGFADAHDLTPRRGSAFAAIGQQQLKLNSLPAPDAWDSTTPRYSDMQGAASF
jgi:hypothetical protein